MHVKSKGKARVFINCIEIRLLHASINDQHQVFLLDQLRIKSSARRPSFFIAVVCKTNNVDNDFGILVRKRMRVAFAITLSRKLACGTKSSASLRSHLGGQLKKVPVQGVKRSRIIY